MTFRRSKFVFAPYFTENNSRPNTLSNLRSTHRIYGASSNINSHAIRLFLFKVIIDEAKIHKLTQKTETISSIQTSQQTRISKIFTYFLRADQPIKAQLPSLYVWNALRRMSNCMYELVTEWHGRKKQIKAAALSTNIICGVLLYQRCVDIFLSFFRSPRFPAHSVEYL